MKIKRVRLYDNSSENSLRVRKILIEKFTKLGIRICDKNYQLAIAIGGDGTFLKMLSANQYNPSIYYTGINLGRIGVLQNIEENEIDLFLSSLSQGQLLIKKNSLLEMKVITTDKKINQYYSFNEFVIREVGLRTTTLSLFVNKEKIEDLVGDGVIISSTIGSSAYNASLGGSIVLGNLEVMQLTPIALVRSGIHHQFFNSLVFSKEQKLMIYPKGRTNSLLFSLDGKNIEMDQVEKIIISLSLRKIKIVMLPCSRIQKLTKKILFPSIDTASR